MNFEKFSYKHLDDLQKDNLRLGAGLHFSENLYLLKRPIKVSGFTIPNSLAAHPMEGTDGNFDGSPDELTVRRYRRFAAGGVGLIWFEAVAVVEEGRVSPRQLWLTKENLGSFKALVDEMHDIADKECSIKPICIAQLTHSGRFSKPGGKPSPIIAVHNPYLNKRMDISPEYPVVEDSYLERLEKDFEEAAVLAKEAGFDGVDVKCCHRYLNSELLSAHTRNGLYGGSYENRTRFLKNVIDRISQRLGASFIVTTRLNIYDGIPYPFGWGVDKEDYLKIDLTEPIKLIGQLVEKGLGLINLTMGTPYYNPHVNRPYDSGGYVPEEHPLEGVSRLVKGIGEVQKAFPDLAVTGTGFSWLRQYSQNLAAGCLEKGLAKIIGFGREMFAYPDFAKDIFEKGSMDERKCCIACSKCTDIMRAGGTAGCVIKDSGVYAPIYKGCVK